MVDSICSQAVPRYTTKKTSMSITMWSKDPDSSCMVWIEVPTDQDAIEQPADHKCSFEASHSPNETGDQTPAKPNQLLVSSNSLDSQMQTGNRQIHGRVTSIATKCNFDTNKYDCSYTETEVIVHINRYNTKLCKEQTNCTISRRLLIHKTQQESILTYYCINQYTTTAPHECIHRARLI